jgi:tetratricopeptide (TPR) repeat protein
MRARWAEEIFHGATIPRIPDRWLAMTTVDRQVHAEDSDRVYQAAGNQYIFERDTADRPPVAVMNTLRRDIATFTGRASEVAALTSAIVRASGSGEVIPVHAIEGMAGVGKTALAVHVGHRLVEHFPDGQMFIELHAHSPGRDPVDPANALAALLAADGMAPDKIPEGLDARVTAWRGRMAGRRVLLIMDDAAGRAQVEPLLPGAPGSLVLITSRRRLAGLRSRYAAVTLALDTLPPDEAGTLFIRLISRTLDPTETRAVAELVQLCGYLPLAISLLAAKLDPEPRWTVTDLLDGLRTAHDRLAQMRAEDTAVAAALDMSYRNLPGARRRYFRRLGLHPGVDVDAYAGAALDGVGLTESRQHLEALYQDHLLDQPELGRYRMHDLVAEYVRALCGKDPAADCEQAIRRLLDYYSHAAGVAGRFLDPRAVLPGPARTPVPPLSSDQALAWLRRERDNLLCCVDLARRYDESWLVAMSGALAAFLRRSGPTQQAIVLHRMAAQVALQSGDHAALANAEYSAGILLRRTSDFPAALAAFDTALGTYRRLLDRRGQADVLRELASVFRFRTDLPKALSTVGEALAISTDIGDRLGRARALDNLAAIRLMTDDYPGAVEALQEALTIYGDQDEPAGRANALLHLGVVQRMTADYPAAERASRDALALHEELGDRLGQANARYNLGVTLRLTGDFAAATEVLRAALAGYEALGERLGQGHALKQLGVVQWQTGDLAGATETLHRAHGKYTEVGDPWGPVEVRQHLGVVHGLKGDLPAAARAFDDALRVYEELGNRTGQAEVLNDAGALLLQIGDPAAATTRYQRALRFAREVHSPLEEARALEGVGQCALRQGRATTGIARLRQALRIYRRIGAMDAARVAAQIAESA